MTLSSEIKTVPVDLGSRRYDIIIGNNILSRASTYIHPLGGHQTPFHHPSGWRKPEKL